jgi:gliding motility-associated-like protein
LADFNITSNNTTNTVCTGGNVALAVSNQASHDYQWRKDGVDVPTAITNTFTATQEGVYTVNIRNTILNCEIETSGVTVTVLTTPVASYTTDASGCTTEGHTFTNTSQVDSRATAVNNWNFGDGFNSTDANPAHIYTVAQTFNPILTVTYQGVSGCSDTDTKPVAVVAGSQPVISASADSSCPDQPVTLSIAGTFASITWSNAGTQSSIDVPPGTYSVTTLDGNGCTGVDEFIVTQKSAPELVATATPATIGSGGTSQLNASGAVNYSWLPAETLSNPAIDNPVASPLQTTVYTVTGTSEDGCDEQAEVTVTVSGVANFPVAFSPNGDGQNDIWNIRAESNPNCTLSIFDGRGRRIFEDQGENWDGTYQGKAVPDGTYFFVYGCPDVKPVTGSVLVFK